jgi:hypothetical protein
MRWTIMLTLVGLLAVGGVSWAQTLLGNCGLTNITGIQFSTGNIYCMPPPSGSCTGTINHSTGCAQPMFGGL